MPVIPPSSGTRARRRCCNGGGVNPQNQIPNEFPEFTILNSYYIYFSEGWKEYLITEIRHPRTQKGHLYAFNGDKTCLCEVICVNDPHSAWFIGNTIGKFFWQKISAVKLGYKERFDKEQIGVKEPFSVTNCQFTS